MPRHSKLQDCEQFLQQENSLTPESEKVIETYLRVSEKGLDEFLVLIPNKIRNDDYLHYILRYMRAHKQFDQLDHERIFNNSSVAWKVAELLAVVEQKDRHAFWYLVHSFESKQEPLYRHLHGPIRCCVCKEIRHKEMEEELDSPDLEGDVTVLSFIKKSLKETIEEKCSTAKAAVKRAKERRKEQKNATISNTEPTTDETEDANNPLDEDKETGDEDYTDAEAFETDLESDVTVLSFIKKAVKETIEEKFLTAKAAMNRVKARRREKKNAASSRKKSSTREASHFSYTFDEDIEYGDEDFIDAEDLPSGNFLNEADELKRTVNATKDWSTVTSEQQLCVVTRRKRAYKAAFTTLSAVSLYTFYPLPMFDFLFLFIYCNLLILVITF